MRHIDELAQAHGSVPPAAAAQSAPDTIRQPPHLDPLEGNLVTEVNRKGQTQALFLLAPEFGVHAHVRFACHMHRDQP